ncbi:MAG: hypothetical protein P4L59_13450 [Desulfosporosinus sp.]|nr:hypothetical protein [Desulfosporosinus sp.]
MRKLEYALLSEHKERSGKKGIFVMAFYGRYFKKVVEILIRVAERISYDLTLQ